MKGVQRMSFFEARTYTTVRSAEARHEQVPARRRENQGTIGMSRLPGVDLMVFLQLTAHLAACLWLFSQPSGLQARLRHGGPSFS
jgi:hypothetical protein